MTLQQLHYAITIAESGSLNKAAEILYIAQPSLTSSMQELEKELGITIFNRSGRGVTLTADGVEFLQHAKQLYSQYEMLAEKYGNPQNLKKKFGVSTQHYSFAVKAFVELVKSFDTSRYEFAIRETKTKDVISDVTSMKSEIGILYLSDFNRAAINKFLHTAGLEFHHLIDCNVYVYIWSGHPLSKQKSIRFEELAACNHKIKYIALAKIMLRAEGKPHSSIKPCGFSVYEGQEGTGNTFVYAVKVRYIKGFQRCTQV